MASVTQFYPCGSAAPYTPTTFRGSWDSNPDETRTLADDKTGSFVGSNARIANFSAPSPYRAGISRFVSNPLEAQTFGGTVDIAFNVDESAADVNAKTKIYMFATVGDSDTVRGVLLDFEDTGATEWPISSTTTVIGLSAPQSLAAVAVQAGDRLVVEIGMIASGAVNASRTVTLFRGSTARLLTGDLLPDCVVGQTGTSLTNAGFIEFSAPVLVRRDSAATGDLLVGNQAIYLYDGTTGALKRRVLPIGSEDPAGGVEIGTDIYISYESLNVGDDPDNGQIARYTTSSLTYQGLFQVTPGVGPHSLSANASGLFYGGFIGDGTSESSCGAAAEGGPTTPVTPASAYIREYTPATGALLGTFAAAVEASGTNAIDLASDQSTMYYTSLGREVKRYDVVSDTQLADFATLPPATVGEMARGLRILPDGTVLVVDTVDIKRLDTSGTVIQTYSVGGQTDWGTISLSPTGDEFWVANRADSAVSAPMICKFDVATGTVLVTINQDDVSLPDTGGGMCSGGITCIGGYRAAVSVNPTQLNGPAALAYFEGQGLIATYPILRVRRFPHLSDERQRIFIQRLQIIAEVGIGSADTNPTVELRVSKDGGWTFGNWRDMSVGKLGQYLHRCYAVQLGMARDWVFEIRTSDPFFTAWLSAVLNLEEGLN